MLLRSQMNDVLAQVSRVGLNPLDFEWRRQLSEITSQEMISLLYHKPGRWWFRFERHQDQHVAVYQPGSELPEERRNSGDWSTQLHSVYAWLTYVKREMEAPDLWALLGQEKALAGAIEQSSDDNSLFTVDERARIGHSLREIKAYMVANYELTSTQTEALDRRLAYLELAAERIGRKDWSVLALGALANVILVFALPPEAARGLLMVAGQVLGSLIHALPLLVP